MTEVDVLTEFFDEGLAGFVITDPNGLVLHANKAFASWLAATPADLKGRRFSDFLAVSGKIYLETHLNPLLRVVGRFDEVALDLTSPSGAKIPVLLNGRERRDAAGRPIATAFIVFRSVERLRYENDILSSHNELQSINSTLEHRVRNEASERLTAEDMYSTERDTAIQRERFIAVLGHDLRNPLAAITAGLGLLSRKPLDPQAATVVALMADSVLRMNAMVGDLMDFARGRLASGMVCDLNPTDLQHPINLAVHELQAAHADSRILLHMDVPGTVDCDPVRITQLVSNLLGNALTHGDASSPVMVDARIADAQLHISITNQGETIPADVLAKLFDPFVKRHEGAGASGLGLGLYISSEIARGHGGSLTATSADGETVFTFTMPQRAG